MSLPSDPVVPPANGGPFVPPVQQHAGQPTYPPQSSGTQPSYPPQQYAQPQSAQPQHYAQPQQTQPQQQPTAWRTLTLDMKQPPWYGWTWLQPTVTIDGYGYAANWSRLNYQIPADRPVYVQCHVNYLWSYGKASAVLEPWHAPHLEYTAPANAWFDGDLGAPGTTKAKGKGVAIGALVFCGLLILGIIGCIALIAVLGSLSG